MHTSNSLCLSTRSKSTVNQHYQPGAGQRNPHKSTQISQRILPFPFLHYSEGKVEIWHKHYVCIAANVALQQWNLNFTGVHTCKFVSLGQMKYPFK